MKIREKFLTGFLVIILLMGVMGYVNINMQNQLKARYKKIADQELPGTLALLRLETSLHYLFLCAEEYVEKGKRESKKEVENILKEIEKYELIHRVYHRDAPRQFLNLIEEKIDFFISLISKYILLKDKRASKDELEQCKRKLEKTLRNFSLIITPFIYQHFEKAYKEIKIAEQKLIWASKVIGGVSILILGIGLIWGFLITHIISKPIIKLTEAVSQVGKGKLDTKIEINSKDEIGELARAFNEMVKNLKELTVSRDIFAQEVKERKKIESVLRESEQKLKAIINSISDLMFMIDSEFNIVWANEVAKKMFTSDIENKKCYFVLHGYNDVCPECIVKTCFEDGKTHEFETRIVAPDGTEKIFWVIANVSIRDEEGKPKKVIEILRDITERKRAEEERVEFHKRLRQVQKMEAIGTLAGGIAHDFNNLLTVINGHTEIALMKAKDFPSIRKDIEAIKKACERAAKLVSQLLAFSRRQPYSPRIINVNEVILELEKMLRRLISEDIKIEIILADDLPPVKADPSQIEQILINLVVNARDAINERTDKAAEKKITIETSYVFLDESYVTTHPESKVGPHVLISVSDTGIGMDEETKNKIFDPFFTTKEMGRGTGLGLATVYGIVKQNNGCIYVYSEPGKGTTFKIYWPVAEETKALSEIPEKKDKEILTGKETILVVEDDGMVRSFAADVLSSLGYKVFEAASGKEALALIKEKGLKIDLLITDLIMPEMNGRELAEKIKEIFPSVPIIFISGYANNHLVRNGMLEGEVNFLQKPFSIQTLSQKVREILDRKKG